MRPIQKRQIHYFTRDLKEKLYSVQLDIGTWDLNRGIALQLNRTVFPTSIIWILGSVMVIVIGTSSPGPDTSGLVLPRQEDILRRNRHFLNKRNWLNMFFFLCLIWTFNLAKLSWLKFPKGTEFLPQTLIFQSIYLYNPMTYTFDISNYKFC